jgi:hypothetical protein
MKHAPAAKPRLRDVCRRAYVVAHTENTGRLTTALEESGFAVTVIRGPYTEEQEGYSRQV